jgi:lambda repressor-like predicted transcriptional regulator
VELTMNRLSQQDRAKILGMLVEGNSMRAISRMADVSINTVTKLLVDVGAACADYHNATLRNLPCKRIQCDEIWGFCYAKERNVPAAKRRVDLDRDMRGYQACPVVARRRREAFCS